MEKDRNGRVIAIAALLLSVIGISIGYSAMSTKLNINGTATMNTAKWSIKLANLSDPVVEGNAEVLAAPQLSDTSIQTYKVKLTKPGDSVTYTFDVINGSDNMNAILGTFAKPNPVCTGLGENSETDASTVCSNLVYTLKYADSKTEVKQNDTLDAKETKKMILTIGYDGNTLPTTDVEITGLDITMIYNQN